MERRTRIWMGLGTALLVSGTAVEAASAAVPGAPAPSDAGATAPGKGVQFAQAEAVDAAGEGGPGEGGGQVLGTITEFRLSTTDPAAFAYDAAAQVSAYASLVHESYAAAHAAALGLRDATDALVRSPSAEALDAARSAWSAARAAYLRTEAFQFYAGPVDGPGGPLPRLNGWPVDPAVVDGLIADSGESLNFRAIARLNRVEAPVKITTGLHVAEYLLWGADGEMAADALAGEGGERRAAYLRAVTQLLGNDLGVLVAAWAPGIGNNYRASVETMDQRNALGRAFNGMAVLVGYELPLRRLGAGLFPANVNYQPSPFSRTSSLDNIEAFEGARRVYVDGGLGELVAGVDPALADAVAADFARAERALLALDSPYERFLAPPSGSQERAAAEEAVRALTDLAGNLRRAGNRLGVLVLIPGM